MAKLLLNYPLYEDNKWVPSTTYNTSSTSQQVTTTEVDGKKISSLKPVDFSGYNSAIKKMFGAGANTTISSNSYNFNYDIEIILSQSNKPQLKRNNSKYSGYNPFPLAGDSGVWPQFNNDCLPNCTGWVATRVLQLMIVTGLAKSDNPIHWPNNWDGLGQNPSNEYSIYDVSNLVDSGNAEQFYSLWPWVTRAHGSGSNTGACAMLRGQGWNVSSKPRVGSICCWGGGYGHVAFVEKIIDEGTDNEAIIVTESGFYGSQYYRNGIRNIVWFSKYYKKNNWDCGSGHYFRGFCYTPLCDLIQAYPTSTGEIDTAPVTVTIDINEPDQSVWDQYYADVEKQKEFAAYGTNGEWLDNLKKNDKVEVQWLGGNEKLDGTGKPLNKMGLQAIIKKNWGQEYKYQYEVGLKNGAKVDTVGFFDRGSLKKLS